MPEPGSATTSLAELAGLFLKLGTTAFGGPAAHIAMMEDEVVRRRGWLTRQEFLDYLGATNLIPGPNSTELALHIGHAQALLGLGRSALQTPALVALGAAAVAAAALGVHELLILFGSGLIMALARQPQSAGVPALVPTLPDFPRSSVAVHAVSAASVAATASFGLWPLFWVFFKTGAVLFGSGYVLLAFLRADLVERLGWLTEQQLLDAVALGQVTPGPVFTIATFVGYLLGRAPGAVVATVAIFLPAFIFVAISGPMVPRLRRSPTAAAVLDGVNVASLALMTVVTGQLGRAALVDPLTVVLAALSAVLLIRFRVNSAWLVLGGATVGLVARTNGWLAG